MTRTSIEWTDHSINPLRARLRSLGEELQPVVNVGHYCEKVSPGCKNCYSSTFQPRFGMPTFQEQRRLDVEHWLDTSKLVEVLKRRKPTKYFWCDMTDMFGEWIPIEHIAKCFATMAATPWHTHQVLTKRPGRARDVLRQLYANDGALLIDAAENLAALLSACHVGQDEWTFPLKNVWLGTSVENQKAADDRISELLEAPAALRFISAEPLLGPLNLHPWTCVNGDVNRPEQRFGSVCEPSRALDWVIVGGESGHGARPFHVAWARDLVKQCAAAGVACFVKQLGAHPLVEPGRLRHWEWGGEIGRGDTRFEATDPMRESSAPWRVLLVDRKGGDMSEWPEKFRVRQFPEVRA